MKIKTIITLIAIGVILVLAAIWILVICTRITEPVTIGDLAYDANERFGYTVYIKETDEYKPYLVLTNKYNGNTLLLRKHILPELRIFNYYKPYMNYYENSEIDKFLNGEYKEIFDETIQNMILPSTIVITNENSLNAPNEETLEIVRDVFLLSVTETGRKQYSALVEGDALKYFKIPKNRFASYETTGKTEGWWLRTPSNYNMATVFCYTFDDLHSGATLGGAAAEYACGVRPAFCVNKNEPIAERDDIVPNEIVYALE